MVGWKVMALDDAVRKVLEALAPVDPINNDELGGCIWCGNTPPGEAYGYIGRNPSHHDHDCPWVAARRLLGDQLKGH